MKTTPLKLLLAVVCAIAITACESDQKPQVSDSANGSAAFKSAAQKKSARTNIPAQPQTAYQNVDSNGLQQLLDQGVTLIDIRLEKEWKATGLIPGSNALTFFKGNGGINSEFLPNLVQLADSNTPVALISDSGNRTLAASRTLANQLGYKKIYNVKGGIKQWIAEGRTVASLR